MYCALIRSIFECVMGVGHLCFRSGVTTYTKHADYYGGHLSKFRCRPTSDVSLAHPMPTWLSTNGTIGIYFHERRWHHMKYYIKSNPRHLSHNRWMSVCCFAHIVISSAAASWAVVHLLALCSRSSRNFFFIMCKMVHNTSRTFKLIQAWKLHHM